MIKIVDECASSFLQNAAQNSLIDAASEEQRKVDAKVLKLAEEQRVYF